MDGRAGPTTTSSSPPSTVAEIRRGILEKPAGRGRDRLEAWFAGPEGPSALFAGRVLPFDESAGLVWAALMARGRADGRPRSALDTIVAATAEVSGRIVVTDNERDFPGVQTFNPARPGPDRAALRARSASFSRSRPSDRAEVLSRRIGPHRGPLGRLSRGSRRSRYPLAPLRRLRAQPFHYSINIKKSNIHMNIIHQTDAPDGTMTPGPTGEPGPGSWTHCRPSRRIA